MLGRYDDRAKRADFSEKSARLYDLKTDRAEGNDLSAQHPEIVRKLAADHEAWEKGIASDRKRHERTQGGE